MRLIFDENYILFIRLTAQKDCPNRWAWILRISNFICDQINSISKFHSWNKNRIKFPCSTEIQENLHCFFSEKSFLWIKITIRGNYNLIEEITFLMSFYEFLVGKRDTIDIKCLVKILFGVLHNDLRLENVMNDSSSQLQSIQASSLNYVRDRGLFPV